MVDLISSSRLPNESCIIVLVTQYLRWMKAVQNKVSKQLVEATDLDRKEHTARRKKKPLAIAIEFSEYKP